jgi:hypothetical protein
MEILDGVKGKEKRETGGVRVLRPAGKFSKSEG